MSQKISKKFAVAIPAYKAHGELKKSLPKLLNFVEPSQVFVINDGVYDKTEELCHRYSVNYLVHERNRGKGAALRTAFQRIPASFEWIITMDADGQHLPEELIRFEHHCLKSNVKTAIVCGARSMRFGIMPPERIFSNRATSMALSLFLKQWVKDTQCGYRAYRQATIAGLTTTFDRFEMESEILLIAAAQGYKISSVPISTVYLDEGPSHISHIKDTLRWIRGVIVTLFKIKREK